MEAVIIYWKYFCFSICNNNQNSLLLLGQKILWIYFASSSGEGKAALRTIRADPAPIEVLSLTSTDAG